MERIGIYGGSFNPPHPGHLRVAQYALKTLGLDKILMIPTGIAPHKIMPVDTPTPAQRLEMLRLLLQEEEAIEASDLELRREGPSYTYETVEQLRELYPQAELFLLVGSDMLESFHKWKETARILAQVTLVAFRRGGKGEREILAEAADRLAAAGARVIVLDNPITELSSTDVRRMLVFQCAKPLLTMEVHAYILENALYGTARDYRNLPAPELEKVVVSLLKENRVKHVLGCADTCAELAVRYGVDETDALRAGLLHDITKALDGDLQLTLCRDYGMILDAFSRQNPKTLHALTGSLVAQRIFGENREVVDAICSHTTGKADMSLLEKILYVADYMEPNRDFPGVEVLRDLAYTDITKALKLGLTMTLDMLHRQQREVSPESAEALAYLESTGV